MLYNENIKKECLDVSTSSHKFIEGIHGIDNVDMDNIKYKYPSTFINSFKEDEAVIVSYYYRYHDFIVADKSDEDLSKTMDMIKLYRDLNRQYLLRSNKDVEEEMKLRKNLSIDSAILNSLPIGQELTLHRIAYITHHEMLNELYLRIEWEESKLLNIIKGFRSGIIKDIKSWSEKYTSYENKLREKWYRCLCLSVKSLFNKLAVYFEQSVADNLKNMDIFNMLPEVNNHEIYHKDRYDYLFNVDVSKIRMVDGLWKLVTDNNYITTAYYKLLDEKYLSFKEVKPSTNTNMSEVECLKKKITPVSPAFNGTNNIMREQDGGHKKVLLKRMLQRMSVQDVKMNLYDEIIADESKKREVEKIKVNMTDDRKSARDKAREEHFAKTSAYNPVSGKQSARDKARETYLAKSSAYGSVSISISSNNGNSDTVKDDKYSHLKDNVKISRSQKREDSMTKYLNESSKPYKMLPADTPESYMLDKDDLHRFEIVTEEQLREYAEHFRFVTYRYLKLKYISARAHKMITSVKHICEKYDFTIEKFMYRFTSMVAKNDIANNDCLYSMVFDKFNKINCDYESLYLFDLTSLNEQRKKNGKSM